MHHYSYIMFANSTLSKLKMFETVYQ